MSVAAELARLRLAGLQTNQRNPAPSLLSIADEASRLPRSDAAGIARNALDLLAHADPSLPQLAEALLLTDPRRDRATLDADTDKDISAAVCVLARRTAPVFSIRPVQKALEWGVRCLSVGTLGSDKEVDALMLAALPFHGTNQFMLLARALFYGGAVKRGKWSGWLAPVVKQGKPVTRDFIVAEAPPDVLRMCIVELADAAAEGVVNCPLAAFVAGVVGRVVAGEGAKDEVARKRLVAEAVLRVDKIRESLASSAGAEGGEKEGGDGEDVGDSTRALGEALSALLVVIAAGALSLDDVDSVVRLAAAKVAVGPGVSEAQRIAAFGVLTTAIGVRTGSGVAMEGELFETLAQGEATAFCELSEEFAALDSLDVAHVRSVVHAYGLAAIAACKKSEFDTDSTAVLERLFRLSGPVLDEQVVTALIERLLSVASTLTVGQESVSPITSSLAKLISPLARSRFAVPVDDGIRNYFSNLSGEATAREVVEKALELALANTPYAIVKAALKSGQEVQGNKSTGAPSGSGVLTVGTLTASMDHPEADIRLAAIRRVADVAEKASTADKQEIGADLEGVGAALLRRISMDSNSAVVLAAMKSPAVHDLCGADQIVDALGLRLFNIPTFRESDGSSLKEPTKLLVAACKLLGQLIVVVESSDESREQVQRRVLGLVVALSAAGTLPKENRKVQKALCKLLAALGSFASSVVLPAVQAALLATEQHEAKSSNGEAAVHSSEKKRKRKGSTAALERKAATITNSEARKHHPDQGVISKALISADFSDDLSKVLFDAYSWKRPAIRPVVSARLGNPEANAVPPGYILEWVKTLRKYDVEDAVSDLPKQELLLSAVDALRVEEASVLDEDICAAFVHIWDCAIEGCHQDVVDKITRALTAGGKTEQTISFLQDRLYESSCEEGRLVAFEILSSWCIASTYQVSDWVGILVCTVYGGDQSLSDAALAMARLVIKHYHGVAEDNGDKDCLVVRQLDRALESVSKQTSRRDPLPKWRGIDCISRCLREVGTAADEVVPLNLQEGEELSTALLSKMELMCKGDDWMSSTSYLRACMSLTPSVAGVVQADVRVVCELLARYCEPPPATREANGKGAEWTLVLALSRLLLNSRCKCLSSQERIELASAISESLSVARGAVSDMCLCLLAELVLTDVSLSTARMSMVKTLKKSVSPLETKVTRSLLRACSLTSREGQFAASLLTKFAPLLPPAECQTVLCALAEKIPRGSPASVKRARREVQVADADDEGVEVEVEIVGIAALEVLSRFASESDGSNLEMPLALSTASAPGLWALVQNLDALCSGNQSDSVTGSMEYQLQLALRVLSVVIRRDALAYYAGHKGVELHITPTEVDAAFNAVAYPGWKYTGAVESMQCAIRDAAVSLVQALAAHPGADMRRRILPVLEMVVRSRSRKGALAVLKAVIPPLVEKGLDAQEFVPQLTRNLYGPLSATRGDGLSEPPRGVVDGISRHELVSCAIVACEDAVTAVALSVNALDELEVPKFASTACAIISKCHLSIEQELLVIARCRKSCTARLLVERLASPDFFAGLDKDDADDGSIKKVEEAFMQVFDALVDVDMSDPVYSDALGVLLGVMPITLLPRCVKCALRSGDRRHALEALRVLSRGLEWCDVFAGSKSRKTARDKSLLVHELSDIILEIFDMTSIESSGDKRTEADDQRSKLPHTSIASLKQGAVCALEKLNLSFGSSNKNKMMACAKRLALFLEEDSVKAVVASPLSPENKEASALVGSTALCLASFVKTLGTMVATLVPMLTSTGVSMMEASLRAGVDAGDDGEAKAESKDSESDTDAADESEGAEDSQSMDSGAGDEPDTSMVIAETGVRVCQIVLSNLPAFFGQSALRRIAVLAVEVRFKVLEDLLVHAVSLVKPSTVVVALFSALESCRSHSSPSIGYVVVMRVVSETVGVMPKREVKNMSPELFTLCLKGLSFRRLAHENMWPSEEVEEVEQAASNALLALVLRLPEADFRPLFAKLVEWMESSHLDEISAAVNLERSLDVSSVVFHAIPFFCTIRTLFETLRMLMLPFFAVVLDRTLEIAALGCRVLEPETAANKRRSAGKRKRNSNLADEERARYLVDAHRLLVRTALSCMSPFVRHLAVADTPNAPVLMRKVMDSTLNAFDHAISREDYGAVNDVVSALGGKIVSIGAASESREESRQLLCAFARGLLLRARSDDAVVRASACESARLMSIAAGDEILVALPEAMPVLADMIDDENQAAEDSARELLKTLETLSGEPILEQLRG